MLLAHFLNPAFDPKFFPKKYYCSVEEVFECTDVGTIAHFFLANIEETYDVDVPLISRLRVSKPVLKF